jgi:hypothetical protein
VEGTEGEEERLFLLRELLRKMPPGTQTDNSQKDNSGRRYN